MGTLIDFFDGTPRPHWAGGVHIVTEQHRLSGGSSDVRSLGRVGATVDRPVSVTAVLLPVSTTGRGTPNVSLRDLARSPQDRGHLMAFSLGAPNTEELMVAQPRIMNQELRDGDPQEDWRAMEVFLAYAAVETMKVEESFIARLFCCCRKPSDVLTKARPIFDTIHSVTGSHHGYYVGGMAFQYPAMREYANRAQPRLVLRYQAVVDWGRSNTAKGVRVLVQMEDTEENLQSMVWDQYYFWEDTEDDQMALLEKPQGMLERKDDAKQWVQQHLRKRF